MGERENLEEGVKEGFCRTKHLNRDLNDIKDPAVQR